MKDFKKDIERAYHQGTRNAADKKDEVWAGISRNLEEQKLSRKEYKKKNKAGLIIAAAAALLVVLTAFTPAGQAAVARIIDLFAPEKEVEITLEGMTEENEYQLHTPEISQPTVIGTPAPGETGEIKPDMTYAIYIDGSRYLTETVDGVDWIRPIDYPEDYPEVSMSIYQDNDRTPSDIAAGFAADLSGEYDTVYDPEEVESPISSIHIYAHDGLSEGEKEDMPQWDSKVTDIYLVDNAQGGTFIVTIKYFMEATEGHGTRLIEMLKDFTIIPVE